MVLSASQIKQLATSNCISACFVLGIASVTSIPSWAQETSPRAISDVSISVAGASSDPLDDGRESADHAAVEYDVMDSEDFPVRVTVGRATDLTGNPSSAQRERFGGSSQASSFSDRPVVLISASRLPLLMPLDDIRMTSGFGTRNAPLLGASRHHAGIDVGAPAGTPIVATGRASVTRAGAAGGYGLMVILDHGNGLETRYAHMSRIAVAQGQEVEQGQVIGFVGSTGLSTGPHLHYETRLDGRPVDPLGR